MRRSVDRIASCERQRRSDTVAPMTADAELDWRRDVAAAVFGASNATSWAQCVAGLTGLNANARNELLARHSSVIAGVRETDDALPHDARRARGAYFTPPELADRLAEISVSPDETGLIVDLSCGDGALLAAVRRRAPHAQLLGVELELEFCAAAAQRLPGATIVWGDGLAHRGLQAAAVVGNPPYVGEKGNRAMFDAVHAAHEDLRQWFAPRIDLHYLFIHRALDILRAGGRIAYLTSEYWLTATGARKLRADLTARTTDHAFERFGTRKFASAPGHHSLLFAATRADQPAVLSSPSPQRANGATWHPFATVARLQNGTPMGELGRDRQGFVSGADRADDAPVFLWRTDELPDDDRRSWFRPVLRANRCVANATITATPGDDWVLWLDGTETPPPEVLALIAPYRAQLEARREVVSGTMPWWRIWWPRRTADYARPKLVVPRRSTRAALCLDLSGAIVSSDCTFILAPDDLGAEHEVEWLTQLMHAANRDDAIAQLRAFGKTKGEVMEFYSAPLREWMLPLRRDGVRLVALSD